MKNDAASSLNTTVFSIEPSNMSSIFNICFYLCVLLFLVYSKELRKLHRQKRLLVWGEGASRIQVITGFGIPVDLKQETVIIGTVVKANYKMPMNSSVYTHPGTVLYGRKTRSISRWDIYDVIAQVLQMRGFGGKSCILRVICEMAFTPVDKRNGLFDELAHMIFNPSSTNEDARHHTDNDYFAAHHLGTKGLHSCSNYFPDCTVNLLDFFTAVKKDF